ncbi:hypothetical protein PG984_000105 [Apiospora sp. TS-2023a]
MDPIWEGDITKVSDCIKFEYILENVHTWATRSLKPLLSSYIDQWRDRFLNGKHRYGHSMADLHKKITALKDADVSETFDLDEVLSSVADMHFELGRADATSAFEASRGLDSGGVFEELEELLDSRIEQYTMRPVAARRTTKAGPDSPPKSPLTSTPFVFGTSSKTSSYQAFETTFAERFAGVQFFADGSATLDASSSNKRFKGSTKSTDHSNLKPGDFSWLRPGPFTRAASAEPLSTPEPPRSDSK